VAILLIAQEPPARRQRPWWCDIETITTLVGIGFLFWIIIIMSSHPSYVTIYVPPAQERVLWPQLRDEL
jgi:hypothetical protein